MAGMVGKHPSLPLALLLMTLMSMFLFANDRGAFYRDGHHSFLSSQSLALAANLSPDHNFLMFAHRTIEDDGTVGYESYNRFPIGVYALTKLAILPFGDSLWAQIYAARTLMLLLFAAAAALAFHAIARLTSNRWIGLTATLLAFSSSYALYYNDMISAEVASVFGIMLTFHGMVIFAQEGRFRQLLVKTCVALLLGWHVAALLLPFVVFGLVKEALKARSAGGLPGRGSWLMGKLAAARPMAAAMVSSRYALLGAVTLAFVTLIMAYNLGSEYLANKGEVPLTELRTFESFQYRIGAEPGFNEIVGEHRAWLPFLRGQFASVGIGSVPFALPGLDSIFNVNAGWNRGGVWAAAGGELQSLYTGMAVFGACLIGLLFVRFRMLAAVLALAGFCWALPLRNSAFIHDFEALFYMGIPLVLFSLILLWVHKQSGNRLLAALSVAAVGVFVFSSFQMSRVGYDAEAAEYQRDEIEDFEGIRGMTRGKTVYVTGDWPSGFTQKLFAVSYYLSGSDVLFAEKDRPHVRDYADFLLMSERQEGVALLTPENRVVFLYDRAIYDGQVEEIIKEAGEPRIRSHFDVYLYEGRLLYVKEPCRAEDVELQFMLHPMPVDVNDLPEYRRGRHDFFNRDFWFADYAVKSGERCAAIVPLPEYEMRSIRTGQYIVHEDGDIENTWVETFDIAGGR